MKILGLDNLERKLQRMSRELRADALAEAAQKGGEVIAKAARARAPRGRTGKLQDDGIQSEITKRSGTVGQAHVGPTKEAFYGRFVEKGTKFAAAKPFMRPAFDEQRDAAVREVERSLRAVVIREAQR